MPCVLYSFYTAGMTFATAKPARGKGVRSTGAQSATHPCGAAGASGSAVVEADLLTRKSNRGKSVGTSVHQASLICDLT
jgi:hypothetical protein